MTDRSPSVKDGAEGKTITMRRHSWDPNSTIEVVLYPHKYASKDVEVFLDDQWIGTVGSYTGSLDRHAGRLRIPGKTRTLWTSEVTREGARTLYGYVSRADAIRTLIAYR